MKSLLLLKNNSKTIKYQNIRKYLYNIKIDSIKHQNIKTKPLYNFTSEQDLFPKIKINKIIFEV